MTAHFLDLQSNPHEHLRAIVTTAAQRKAARVRRQKRQARAARGGVPLPKGQPDPDAPLRGHMLALLFARPSTRTRVSFAMAMRQLGGDCLDLGGKELQLQRGETLGDTGRVLARYADGIVYRGDSHDDLLALAEATGPEVPVINGLSRLSHPCQVLADILTFEECKGDIAGRTLSWIGDGRNNMATTWIHAAVAFGFHLRIGCPPQLAPDAVLLAHARRRRGSIQCIRSPLNAAKDSDAIMTDTWVSMAANSRESAFRRDLLTPYNISEHLMELAPNAIFMHCLPANRGQEVSNAVMDGPASRVFLEAENRLHVQKAILLHCFGKLAATLPNRRGRPPKAKIVQPKGKSKAKAKLAVRAKPPVTAKAKAKAKAKAQAKAKTRRVAKPKRKA